MKLAMTNAVIQATPLKWPAVTRGGDSSVAGEGTAIDGTTQAPRLVHHSTPGRIRIGAVRVIPGDGGNAHSPHADHAAEQEDNVSRSKNPAGGERPCGGSRVEILRAKPAGRFGDALVTGGHAARRGRVDGDEQRVFLHQGQDLQERGDRQAQRDDGGAGRGAGGR